MDAAQRIDEHLPLVSFITSQLCLRFPSYCDREELVRAGTLGLVEAAHRYDPERGIEFRRFASYRIRGAIFDALRSRDWTSRGVRAGARQVEAARERFIADNHRTPTSAEVAEYAGITQADLATIERRVHESLVLALDGFSSPESDDDTWCVDDLLTDGAAPDPAAALEQRELHAYLRDAIKLLPERHRLVVIGAFFEDKTNEDLARTLGVTESRISQMRSEAFTMLRDGIDAQYREPSDEEIDQRGRVARRKAAYAAAISTHRSWRERLGDSSMNDRVPALSSAARC